MAAAAQLSLTVISSVTVVPAADRSHEFVHAQQLNALLALLTRSSRSKEA